MARTNYTTSASQMLTFWRGSSDPTHVEVHPADLDGDVYMKVRDTPVFLRREQARRLARALLEAAGE